MKNGAEPFFPCLFLRNDRYAKVSLKRRGGCGINKKMRSHRRAADGVVRPAKSSGLDTFAELTTPSARTKVASRYLFDRASTPPFQGGEFCSPEQFIA
jgi:hypothetical protein